MIAILALYIILGLIAVIYILLRFSIRITYSFDSTANVKAYLKIKYFFFTVYENPESEKRKMKKAKKLKRKEEKLKKKESKLKKKKISKPDKNLKTEKSDIIDEINNLSDEETEEKIKELEKEIAEQKEIYENTVKSGKKDIGENSNQTKPESNAIKKKNTKSKKDSKLSEIKEKWKMIKPYAPLTWKTLRKLLRKIRFYNTKIDILLGNEDPYKAAVNYGYANIAFYQSLAFLCMIFSVKIKSCDLNTEFIEKKFEARISGNVYVRVSTILAILICYGVKMLKIYISEKSKNSDKHKKQDKELLKNEQ